MKEKVMWTVFAILVAVFNAVAVGAALLVIAPTISQAGPLLGYPLARWLDILLHNVNNLTNALQSICRGC